MGKASRRMNKRRQQQAAQAGQQASQELHKTLDALYEKGEYADVINTLAEIVQAKQQTAEDLYKGAYSYFMIGDYTRAAGLVTTVLNAAPDHVAARIPQLLKVRNHVLVGAVKSYVARAVAPVMRHIKGLETLRRCRQRLRLHWCLFLHRVVSVRCQAGMRTNSCLPKRRIGPRGC